MGALSASEKPPKASLSPAGTFFLLIWETPVTNFLRMLYSKNAATIWDMVSIMFLMLRTYESTDFSTNSFEIHFQTLSG